MADKLFVGRVEEKTFSNGGSILRLSLNADDRTKIAQNVSTSGFVNIKIQKSQKGSYYAEIDTWQPKENNSPAKGKEDDLPF